MTKFQKDQFSYHGGYLTYGPDRRFVARFKYSSGGMAHFRAFLVKNFTVEEYFTARATDEGEGLMRMPPAPATILERKGYVSPNQAKACAREGFPATRAGYESALHAVVARSYTAVMARKMETANV